MTDINNFVQKGSSFSCSFIGIEKFDMLSQAQRMLPAIRDLAGDQYVFHQGSELHSFKIRVLAAEGTCLHFCGVVATKQSVPQPCRLKNFGLHVKARIQKTKT
jgi:hypothetical protein